MNVTQALGRINRLFLDTAPVMQLAKIPAPLQNSVR